ncbi:hypothetical protein ES332_D10G194000v1 [Gossypium tomentosum]|uniref:Uncharacterized protein n=1 Tax=Gossypium tomentosum TaxID=34277 RepID=A0A5D2J6Q2_GOSTO|nr:hypothetical protein ES332_D10G194000v1 [Gossypium tomentosum]
MFRKPMTLLDYWPIVNLGSLLACCIAHKGHSKDQARSPHSRLALVHHSSFEALGLILIFSFPILYYSSWSTYKLSRCFVAFRCSSYKTSSHGPKGGVTPST